MVKDLSGPVGIVKTVGDQYTRLLPMDLKQYFDNGKLIILISANLGVMNLLPLHSTPDGGPFIVFDHRSNYWKGRATEYGSAGTHCRVDLINAFDGICNNQDIVKIFM